MDHDAKNCILTKEGKYVTKKWITDEYEKLNGQVGLLVMENLTLKLENEAYQKHIKEMEDGKTN